MNRYFQEVIDAHELICRWLGDAETQDSVCDKLLARFSPRFTLVSPTGGILNSDALNRFFRTQRGARKGLSIAILDMQIVAENEKGACVVYKERQQWPGQDATLRFSTAVFERGSDGHAIWRHLHETFLPQA